jgi:3-phosphoshikimate 1-carboxyvinyltransferase
MLGCLIGLGAHISKHNECNISGSEECFEIEGSGLEGLTEPKDILYAGNSGTTMRLISGLLAGQDFFSVITGDGSLRNRPMKRITTPLTQMGAKIEGREGGALAPLSFRGGELAGIEYTMPVASAQLKSCLLIAGLFATGKTIVIQPAESRDHTERMLSSMGGNIENEGLTINIQRSELRSVDVRVPSDTSGSAFWLVAGCCHPNASIRLKNVGMNPTRIGMLEVLESMEANISIENERMEGGEPVADIVASTSSLRATEIHGDVIPRVVDELPVLSLAACFAKGTTIIRDAEELRVKESDRISATVDSLSRLGATIEETPDGMKISGGTSLAGAEVKSHGDHRIAMTNAIAGLVAEGETTIEDSEAASVSYPSFWNTIEELRG